MTGASPTPATPEGARADLAYLEELLRRSRRRIDTHAFHGIHWGAIVAVWYPLANAFQLYGNPWWKLPLGIAAVALGVGLSVTREARLARAPRTPDEDDRVGDLVRGIVFASLAAGFVLSAFAPATRWIAGENVPVLWGLVYANIGVMIGLVYRRDYLWWGCFIFAATLAAMVFQRYGGFILGPCMALGSIVPALRAERSVRQEREPAVASV